jgi:hypothetical protein
VKKRVGGGAIVSSIRVAHILILLVAASQHGIVAIAVHHHHSSVVVLEVVGNKGRKGREDRNLKTVLRGHGLKDLKTSPDFLVLALDRIHEVAGLVHLLDFLFQLLDVGLAAVAECALGGAVLGSAARMGDVS